MMDLQTLRQVNELAARHPGLTVGQLLEVMRDMAEGRPPRDPSWYEPVEVARRLLDRSRKLSAVREAIKVYRREVRRVRRQA